MKNKYYYPNQLYIVALIIVGVIYAIFLWVQYQQVIKNGILVERTISSINCHPYTKLQSSIRIRENNKLYYVKVDYDNCVKYSANEKITLWYYKAKDLYFYPVEKPNHVKRIIILVIVLIISLIPWQHFIRIYNSNK